jgi:hypothetical protein
MSNHEQAPAGAPEPIPAVLGAPPATGRPAPAPRRGLPALTVALGGVLVAVLAFGGGFWTGRQTAPEPQTARGGPGGQFGEDFTPGDMPSGGPDGESGGGWGTGGMRGGGASAVTGEITEAAAGQITVKLEDGSLVTVNLTDETVLTETKEIAAGDLAVGDEVTVMGSGGEDGSSDEVDAVRVQRGDVGGFAAFGGGGPAGPGDGDPPSSS